MITSNSGIADMVTLTGIDPTNPITLTHRRPRPSSASSQTAFLTSAAKVLTLTRSKLPHGTPSRRAKPVSDFEPTYDAAEGGEAITKIDLAVDYSNPSYKDNDDFEY